jgi:hypothetical protein
MANTFAPWGARPVRRIDGASPTYQLNHYQLAYNNGNVISRGDVVKLLSSGYIDLLAPGSTAPYGVFFGCEYIDPNLGRKVWNNQWNAVTGLASTAIVDCYIIEDRRVIFEIQTSVSSAAVAQSAVGNNAQFAAGTASGLPYGQSGAYINAIATTNTHPWRVVGLSQKIGNDNTSAFNTIECVLNAPQLDAALGV